MSNEGQSTTNPPHLPFHAYANIGDQDNLISVKRSPMIAYPCPLQPGQDIFKHFLKLS